MTEPSSCRRLPAPFSLGRVHPRLVVAVDEILGWIVAGLVTLGGVLAASYLKQRHHLNALKKERL